MTNLEKLNYYISRPDKYLVTYVDEFTRAVYLRENGNTDKRIALIELTED